jgi:hypothetical protein
MVEVLKFDPKKKEWVTDEYSPDLYVIMEVGRELSLPEYIKNSPIKKVSAVRKLELRDFPVVSRDFIKILMDIPIEQKVAIIPSGAIIVSILWAAFLGFTHRVFAVGQWNAEKADYEWVLVDPNLRNFFLAP